MKSFSLAFIVVVSLLFARSIHARDDGGPKYSAPPEIVAALPKVCWWLYMDNVPNTPEFNILDCGNFSNHYCPGIVQMKRAEREKTTSEKLNQLRMAKDNMEYTLHYTEGIPECSIRLPAKMNLERIKFQMDVLKWQPRNR